MRKNNLKESIKELAPDSALNFYRIAKSLRYQKLVQKMARYKRLPFKKPLYPAGINLIGDFSKESGLGQSCRLLAREIEMSGIQHSFINFTLQDEKSNVNHEFENKYAECYTYGINIFHINMHEMAAAFQHIKCNFNYHYNIAFWLWENENFPREWVPMTSQFDEIWTPSEFTSNSIRSAVLKKVCTVPYYVTASPSKKLNRKDFELPEDKFLYLMLYDYNSLSERKNPDCVLDAFQRAAAGNVESSGLVIKITNASHRELDRIRQKMNGYHVYFVQKILTRDEVNALIQCCDVYVSLHRAEGYGLVLAEAMALGVPTISTNYSANTEFQTKDSACLVNYSLKRIEKYNYPYKKNDLWADPDPVDAAFYMRKLRDDKTYYHKIRENALNYMNNSKRKSIPVESIQKAVKEIYETH